MTRSSQIIVGVIRRRRTLIGVAFILPVLIFIGLVHERILFEIASFLVVEDSLEPAAAIVPLAGRMPFREIEAARIYKAGWAPELVVVKGSSVAHSRDLQDLGLPIEEAWKVGREIIIRQGVPPSAIILLKDEPPGTLGELQAAYKAVGPKDAPIILVTSKYHTRRVRLTWEYVTKGRSRAIVRAAHGDPFDLSTWWRQRDVAWAVAHEYLGLINYYAGFPISGGWRTSRAEVKAEEVPNRGQRSESGTQGAGSTEQGARSQPHGTASQPPAP